MLDVPFDPERGSHNIKLMPTLFIDATDFRQEDSKEYFGLAPGKVKLDFVAMPGDVSRAVVLYMDLS